MGTKKSSIPLIALGSVIGGILIVDAFRAKQDRNKKKKNKKWLSWEIQFKEGMGDEEKAKAINLVEKQIIDYLYKEVKPGVIVRSIKFSFTSDSGNGNSQITVSVRFENVAKVAVKTPPIPPPNPFREVLNNLPIAIHTIKIMEIH